MGASHAGLARGRAPPGWGPLPLASFPFDRNRGAGPSSPSWTALTGLRATAAWAGTVSRDRCVSRSRQILPERSSATVRLLPELASPW